MEKLREKIEAARAAIADGCKNLKQEDAPKSVVAKAEKQIEENGKRLQTLVALQRAGLGVDDVASAIADAPALTLSYNAKIGG